MCKVLIFGGTTEGRELAEFCAENEITSCVSVATEYGAKLLERSVRVRVGRMNADEMAAFIAENRFSMVLDATHPYAVEATENINKACRETAVHLVRVLRGGSGAAGGRYFDDLASLTDYLNETDGAVFVTTGSKELAAFKKLKNYRERCAVRVLPTSEAAEVCLALGFEKSHIIAEKGPFTEERNIEQLRRFDAKYLVTKDSGAAGGFAEKLSAAEKCGAKALIIRRPGECGVSLSEAKNLLLTVKKHG